jgi:hypothetical protein
MCLSERVMCIMCSKRVGVREPLLHYAAADACPVAVYCVQQAQVQVAQYVKAGAADRYHLQPQQSASGRLGFGIPEFGACMPFGSMYAYSSQNLQHHMW